MDRATPRARKTVCVLLGLFAVALSMLVSALLYGPPMGSLEGFFAGLFTGMLIGTGAGHLIVRIWP